MFGFVAQWLNKGFDYCVVILKGKPTFTISELKFVITETLMKIQLGIETMEQN